MWGWITSLGQSGHTPSCDCGWICQNHGKEKNTTLALLTRHTDPYFISFADLLLLITQISLAAFQVTFHIFNTHLRRAASVFAQIHDLGRAFIRCCTTLHKRCCLIEALVNMKHVTDGACRLKDPVTLHSLPRQIADTHMPTKRRYCKQAKPSFKEWESTWHSSSNLLCQTKTSESLFLEKCANTLTLC